MKGFAGVLSRRTSRFCISPPVDVTSLGPSMGPSRACQSTRKIWGARGWGGVGVERVGIGWKS